MYVGSKQARAAVISRLSSERAGTRFCVRGVDDDGHVANFVETEQLITLDESSSSFMQIRGSVPLFWEQPGVNVGSHKIRISRGPELSAPAFDSHFRQLKALYGDIIIMNLLGSCLVGSKEGEATLSTAFQTHQKSSPHTDVPHILWDFHSEGGHKNIDRLDRKVAKYAEQLDFFHKAGPSVTKKQTGVIRTNCTDCLDRTNAVQAHIGVKILTHQLARMKLDQKENIVSRFQDGFKQMWINNGNTLSKLYAGTAALCSVLKRKSSFQHDNGLNFFLRVALNLWMVRGLLPGQFRITSWTRTSRRRMTSCCWAPGGTATSRTERGYFCQSITGTVSYSFPLMISLNAKCL